MRVGLPSSTAKLGVSAVGLGLESAQRSAKLPVGREGTADVADVVQVDRGKCEIARNRGAAHLLRVQRTEGAARFNAARGNRVLHVDV